MADLRRLGRALSWLLAASSLGLAARAGDAPRAEAAVTTRAAPQPAWLRLGAGIDGFRELGLGAIRGVTIGPIESSLHAGRGYGSEAYRRALDDAKRLGATWISLTPFGRVADLAPSGVAMTFEVPFATNRAAVHLAVRQAHERGLRVLLVPHLWVESGGWRGEIDPGSAADWERWSRGYAEFLRAWAAVAEESQVDMLAVGVELRSWVTTSRAPSFARVVRDVRSLYRGLLTYAANWDDVDDTVILGEIDVIGVNAFFPLVERAGAGPAELERGGRAVASRLAKLSTTWNKPIVFTEFGYTTRTDPALRPWEWPDHMVGVQVDQQAQADAYAALLAGVIDEPWFVGAFVWRVYSDPDDVSQEAEWGFSPRGKLAELVLRDAFAAHWATDGPRPLGAALHRHRAERIGIY
jgi:hypothetical protein